METKFIALLTDFGEKDFFVPSLKAVIAGINPEARVIDITHEVPSFDIRAASFILFSCYAFFPKGTIFLAVVDPGVASGRPILLAETKKYFFIAPDNGLLSLALKNEKIGCLRKVTESRYWLAAGPTTFEARDRMAPVAAWLTHGLSPGEFGPRVKSFRRLKIRKPVQQGDEIAGEILSVDKFGNLMSNISLPLLKPLRRSKLRKKMVIHLGKTRIDRFVMYYAEVKDNQPFFLVNSQGLIEIAVNQGSAAAALGAKVGDPVKIRLEA